jgi:hypothetical protein
MDGHRPRTSPDHEMESVDGLGSARGDHPGNLSLRAFEERSFASLPPHATSDATPHPTTTRNPGAQGLGPPEDPRALHDKNGGRPFTAFPDPFDGRKSEYRRFRRQFGLFITANRSAFVEEASMIWFVLSYMKGGDAELWANVYVDKAIESNDWGQWTDFLDQMTKDFGDSTEPHKALEELGKLQQGKKTAAEFFLRFEQLADAAGVDLDRYPNATLYVEKNVQRVLIDQLYQSDNPPVTYRDYKRRITVMDEMRRRRETQTAPRQNFTPRPKDTSAMEVDRSQKKETRSCFQCRKEGHLARNCTGKKKDF